MKSKKYTLFYTLFIVIYFLLASEKCFSMCGCCKYLWRKYFGKKHTQQIKTKNTCDIYEKQCVGKKHKQQIKTKNTCDIYEKQIVLLEKFKFIEKFFLGYGGIEAISPCGNYVAVLYAEKEYGDKKHVAIFDIKSKKVVFVYEHETGNIYRVSFSYDGNYVAVGTGDSKLIVFDIKNKKIEYWSKWGNQISGLFCIGGNKFVLVFNKYLNKHQNGRYSSYCVGRIAVLDMKNKKIVQDLCQYLGRIISVSEKYIASYAFNRNGMGNNEIIIYDIKRKKAKCSYLQKGVCRDAIFSKCGKYIVTGPDFSRVTVFDIKNKKVKFSYRGGGRVKRISFSRDSCYVLLGYRGGQVLVLDVENKKLRFLYEHDSCAKRRDKYVKGVSFSNDNDRIVSVSKGGQVIVHKTSPEFYYSNTIYENKKKQNKLLKQNLKKINKNFSDVKILLKK
ncbi:WD40 repeat domain-containing protein [Candidatus Dependentiae bacterium]